MSDPGSETLIAGFLTQRLNFSEVEKLAENGRRKRELSCNKRGIISLVVYYDDAFYNR